MKNCLGFLVSSVWLTRSTSHLNIRAYRALAKADTANSTCAIVWPFVTHSVPTFTLGIRKALRRSAQFTPNKWATCSNGNYFHELTNYKISSLFFLIFQGNREGTKCKNFCNLKYPLSFCCAISFCLLLSGSLFELHVTKLHYSRRAFVQGHLFVFVETQNCKSLLLK